MDVSQWLVTQTSLVGQYTLFLRVLPDLLDQSMAGVPQRLKILRRWVLVRLLDFFKISFNIPHKLLDFPGTQQIFLVENYRSTGSILASSLAIVAQGSSFFTFPSTTPMLITQPIS